MNVTDATILIPLHESACFIDTVRGNIARLIGSCSIIVSDATGRDDTLRVLEREWADHGVRFIGPRRLWAGWVAHYNDLLARVDTPRFLWLAHDDEIDGSHVATLGHVLDQFPDAACACGLLESIEGPGLDIVSQPRLPAPAANTFRCRANQLLFAWNLGVMFRGLFRRCAVGPIPHTTATDEWADIVWLYGISLDHPVVQTDRTTYRKRFSATTTHAAWRAAMHPLALPYLVNEVVRRDGLADRLLIIEQLVSTSIARFEKHGDSIAETIAARRKRNRPTGWRRLVRRMRGRS